MKMFNKFIKLLGHIRWYYRYVYCPVCEAKRGYSDVLPRLRKEARSRKLRVGFVVGSLSKWKCQSVYDLMRKSDRFDPVIVLTICDVEGELIADQRAKVIKSGFEYFTSRGMACQVAYSIDEGRCVPLSKFNLDIVFYSQPWGVADCQLPHRIANRALTFYVPYFVPNYGGVAQDCESPFQRTTFAYFTPNEKWSKAYADHLIGKCRANRFVATGHPALDGIHSSGANKYVIYAPHWSIDHPMNENSENFSTFLKTGLSMLEYAQSHPELNWVFKPHPTLRSVLAKIGWDERQIDSYYSAWCSLGVYCSTGDYIKYFCDSRAIVTDCASFLVEYAATGKPIVHLKSKTAKIKPISFMADLFGSYYSVLEGERLTPVLDQILLAEEDPKRDVRIKEVSQAQLMGGHAAENIVSSIGELLESRADFIEAK